MINQSFVLDSTKGRLASGASEVVYSDISTDTRRMKKDELFIALKGDNFDGHNFIEEAFEKGAKGVLVEDIPNGSLEINDKSIINVNSTINALGDLALAWRKRFKNLKVVCITGSNGKTTTKEMAYSILSVKNSVLKNFGNVNNHVGLPLTLLKLKEDHDMCVVEIGMNDFGEIKRLTEIAQPDIGTITNIGRAHLEKLKTLEGVARAKGELVEDFDENNTFVVNSDDDWVKKISDKVNCNKITFGLNSDQFDISADNIETEGLNSIKFSIKIRDIAIKTRIRGIGMHNVLNALCASGIALALGCTLEEIQAGLERYSPVYMRLEIVEALQGFKIINDAYNANPDSMAKALEELSRLKNNKKAFAVIGDMMELGPNSAMEHRKIGELIKNLNIDFVITLGDYSKCLTEEIHDSVDSIHVDSHKDAANILIDKAKDGDIVLVKGSRGMRMEKVIQSLF